MNKKFTMVCASLLLASAFSVNAATTQSLSTPTVVQAVVDEVTEGFKFYLAYDASDYYSVNVEDNKATFNTTAVKKISEASVFEVRNLKKVGTTYAQFELYVDGIKLYNSNKTVSEFYASLSDGKLKPSCLGTVKEVVFAGEGTDVWAGLKVSTISLDYKAVDLNNFNNEGTTFSFDFADNELVGNLFKDLTPVTVGSATYFLKGEKAAELTAFDLNSIKGKGLQILAIDNKNDYALNTSKAGEGLKLRMVDAEKFLTYKESVENVADKFNQVDSLSLAGFTSIKELDMLNNAKELILTMKPNAGLLVETAADFNIAAVKTSESDTKAYVTTVKAGENASSWAVVKNALLGDNTYFAASEFLKEGMRAVAILNVKDNAETNGNYYKYLVESTLNTTVANATYQPASEIDFEMPQNQWVITKFDGQYTLTLKNRLTEQQIVISNIAKTEKGYKGQLSGAATGLDGNIEFKLLDLATTKTDGYKVLSENEIKNGITLAFSGETQLAGEKVFFGVLDKENSKMVPSLDTENLLTLYPVLNIKADKSDVILNDKVEYAYLKDGKMLTAKDTLVVPTYFLATELDEDGEIAKVLDQNYSVNVTKTTIVWAFAKNMAGNYSVYNVNTDVNQTVLANAPLNVIGVKYNKSTSANPDGLEFTTVSRYDSDNVVNTFASVNVSEYNKLNTSLPAVPGHYTFDNARGSINVKDLVGINEGFLASEGQVFWLDTADIEKATPSFYISFGKDSVAARNYMFNPIDSAKVFDEYTAKYTYNDVYYYGEDAMVEESTNEAKGTLKAAFASTVAEEGKDLADAFKFNITLKDAAVADEYVISSVKDPELFVSQINGVVVLAKVDKKDAMAFTVNPAEAPTSNESVSASEVKVIANNGSVVVKNAAGKNVVVSTILGQVVANEVLTSDNATINVPAGIVVVAVDGESFKVSVK